MKKIPVISTDTELNERTEQVIARFGRNWEPVFIADATEALAYLAYELPDVSVINLSDASIDTEAILNAIKADPWLHYGGLVAVYRRRDEARVSSLVPNSQIVSAIRRGEFVTSFFRLLKIITENRFILFHRDIQSYFTGEISGSFVMDNDPFNVRTYANLVSNFLFNSNYVDRERRERIHVAIFEMLMNAVEHGNCGITHPEKTRWLEAGNDSIDLIRSRLRDNPESRAKRVQFGYRITPTRSFFKICDEGEGFDWRAHIRKVEEPAKLAMHGHGIRMARHYMEDLVYNDAGNEVEFEIAHNNAASNIVPEIFRDQTEQSFDDGEVIFSEGEESNSLYYIVAGTLSVQINGHELSVLTPHDMFLGEMSFLLNDRRSATVMSKGSSQLIPISKNAFVEAIKKNPHYGIFLARLLAQRLLRLNARVSSTA